MHYNDNIYKIVKTILRESYNDSISSIIFEDYDSDIEHNDELNKTGFWGKAGAGAIIVAKTTGKILLPKRSPYVEQPGTWGVWGGAIDKGKSPEQAVTQEIEEECGYNGHFELYPLYVFKDTKSEFKYYNFLAVVEEEFEPVLNWETSKYGWFDLNELPSPLHFGVKTLFNDPASIKTIKKFTKNEKKKNVVNIKLTLNELGLKKFKNVPTFKNLLHTNQLKKLNVGHNNLTVNHTVWGSIQRVVGYDAHNMSVAKIEQ